MKTLLSTIVCLGLAITAIAQETENQPTHIPESWQDIAPAPGSIYVPPPGNVHMTVDMVSVSREEAFDLVREEEEAIWAKVVEMVKGGTAASDYLASVTVTPGERGVVDCILEARYPTEFEPPLLPAKGEIAKLQQSQLFPTSFDVRYVGTTLEILPTVHKDGISLELIPSRKLLERFVSFPVGMEKSLLRADQPVIDVQTVKTTVTVESGKPLLLAVGDMAPSSEEKNADRVLLFFVTASFEPAK